jgi:hypothetical protein
MTRRRMLPFIVATGLVLGLSACTNPYDPVQRFIGGGLIGAGSGAAIGAAAAGGHGAALGAGSAEPWVQWVVLSQRRHRPLITDTTIVGNTAITITNTTRATTGENIIVLTADKRWEALRRLRQMRPRGTERQASFSARPDPALGECAGSALGCAGDTCLTIFVLCGRPEQSHEGKGEQG